MIFLYGVGENRHHFFFFGKALDKWTNVLYNSKLVNNVFTLQLKIKLKHIFISAHSEPEITVLTLRVFVRILGWETYGQSELKF